MFTYPDTDDLQMSFNNLVFFNGDVRRDRKQEAMFNSLVHLNERDNFLNRLKQMEEKREKEERQTKAVRKIQKLWRGHRVRRMERLQFRARFDAISEGKRSVETILEMSQLLVNFYEFTHDEERLVMTLVELVKARTADRSFETRVRDSQRLLLARCCVKFLNHATENTIFFHIFRYLEDYVTCHLNLFEAISTLGLFEAEFHLLEALLGKPTDNTIQKASINPRHQQLLTRIFECFLNPEKSPSIKVADRLLKTICVNVSDLNFANCIMYYIKDHIKLISTKSVLFHAICQQNLISQWKLRPEQVETASIRLRALFLTSTDNQMDQTELKTFFDSLAPFLEAHRNQLRNLQVKEDLSESGRLRTAVNHHLSEYTENILTSNEFRRATCVYANLPNVCVSTIISLRKYFTQSLDLIASSNSFIEALYTFIAISSQQQDLFGSTEAMSTRINALELFCICLNKRVSSVADSDFVANDFIDFDNTIEFLRDASIKLINLMFPNLPRGDLYSDSYSKNMSKAEAEWKDVTEAVFSILGAVYQKDCRIKYFPQGFWTNHGREVLTGIGEQKRMPRRRLPNGRVQIERTLDTEFVERLSAIYEHESDSENEDDEKEENGKLPAALRRAICVMKHIPFIVPFMDRVSLFSRLLNQDHEKAGSSRSFMQSGHHMTIRRDQVYMDAYNEFAPKAYGDRVRELKSMLRIKMVNWAGVNEPGVDGGGIFREFLTELLKTAFNVDRGFFTETDGKLLYPNPTAPFLLGADCQSHFQFIGRMIGKLIYERQLHEVRFAEFFISQIFETNPNKDVDLQHMKSFDPLIFKHLKALQKMNDKELDELQLDFSIVTSDVGLVRTVNLKPNGSKHRVTVDNVTEYVRLYVNYHLKQRISSMVTSIRRGISEVISIEWMRMFAPHELQILIAGFEEVFTVKEMRKHCEIRFSNRIMEDSGYVDMFWDVIENLSNEDKMAFLKFITGCSRTPVDGFKSLYPAMGVLVLQTSEDELPTSATCMNMLRIPKYSTRTKLEEKLRYAINSGAGFELA
uniref:HECT-type E3 ubiquitin transferase n=1 Tax=Caenorhabditis tropicalis TaxID=1561998 RepID=A0A1I7U5J7_9PELO